MILAAIKQFFIDHKMANTAQLCQQFSLTRSALEPMLAHWEHKGLIKPYDSCENCTACPSSALISHYILTSTPK